SHSEPTTPGEATPVETSPEPGTSHRSASSKRASADAS
ncbi:sugar phosphate isomerase/epimerase, partial [Burkholderia multivorans]